MIPTFSTDDENAPINTTGTTSVIVKPFMFIIFKKNCIMINKYI